MVFHVSVIMKKSPLFITGLFRIPLRSILRSAAWVFDPKRDRSPVGCSHAVHKWVAVEQDPRHSLTSG